MDKKEFLAFSLPYGLYCRLFDGIFKIIGINGKNVNIRVPVFAHQDIDFCKPILHPLSDLTKEIEHNGERIHTLKFLCEKYRSLDPHQLLAAIGFGTVDFNIMIDLIALHFDVYGLIEKGEAIDVNTLDVNPYK